MKFPENGSAYDDLKALVEAYLLHLEKKIVKLEIEHPAAIQEAVMTERKHAEEVARLVEKNHQSEFVTQRNYYEGKLREQANLIESLQNQLSQANFAAASHQKALEQLSAQHTSALYTQGNVYERAAERNSREHRTTVLSFVVSIVFSILLLAMGIVVATPIVSKEFQRAQTLQLQLTQANNKNSQLQAQATADATIAKGKITDLQNQLEPYGQNFHAINLQSFFGKTVGKNQMVVLIKPRLYLRYDAGKGVETYDSYTENKEAVLVLGPGTHIIDGFGEGPCSGGLFGIHSVKEANDLANSAWSQHRNAYYKEVNLPQTDSYIEQKAD